MIYYFLYFGFCQTLFNQTILLITHFLTKQNLMPSQKKISLNVSATSFWLRMRCTLLKFI